MKPSIDRKTANKNPIIVALDVRSAAEAQSLVAVLEGAVGAFKVGLELFNAEGPSIFSALREAASEPIDIFYDAKLHDIPNTVAGAIAAAGRHDLWMINVHASGGAAMMTAAVERCQQTAMETGSKRPLVIAVTVLTSIDARMLADELSVQLSPEAQVVNLAKLAQASGCDGVVASPLEIEAIRGACGSDFLIVTPGVRPAGADLADQKRVMTPGEAICRGASYLVVGRPITHAASPRDAAESIFDEIQSARGE